MMRYYTTTDKKMVLSLLLVSLLILACAKFNLVEARGGDDDETNDFDDPGFDDSGYNQPRNHDAEGSHHSPTSSVEDDIDDDDDVDETHVNPVTSTGQMSDYDPSNELYGGLNYNYNPDRQYHQSASDAPYARRHRFRRSLSADNIYDYLTSASGVATESKPSKPYQKPLHRLRRHSKYIGPVYTYVKTDKKAHFKWGVKHKVGKKHYR